MENIWIRETFVNATKHWIIGDSESCETFTDNKGKLFMFLQKEYGRCISKMYIDKKDGSVETCGWVFQKRIQYEDCKEFYVREVWVSIEKEG